MEKFNAAMAYDMHDNYHSNYEEILLRDVEILKNG